MTDRDDDRADEAAGHLRAAYPRLAPLFDAVAPPRLVLRGTGCIGTAVTQVVTGQSISRTAATAIYQRVLAAAEDRNLGGCWRLDAETYVKAGLSRSKARTIREFAARFDADPDSFESWRTLDRAALTQAVSAFWGLGAWSADVLALFYFGNPDIFPAGDGTLKKGVSLVEEHLLGGAPLDPEPARPYRSYLALYLWRAVDAGVFHAKKSTI